MKKRAFLQLASASAVTVLVSGGVWRTHDRGVFSVGQGSAYEPWQTWRSDQPEGVLALVRAAILAASPHNTQPSAETSHKFWVDATKSTLASNPVFGLIAVRDLYDQSQTLRVGKLWQRMHLWATTQKLAVQPINQLPEMVDREHQLGKDSRTAHLLTELIGDLTWKPTFTFRLGYATLEGLASARRSIEDVIV